jgi:phospholipid N-methyltransferase
MNNTVDIWEKLHKEEYFYKHRLYNDFRLSKYIPNISFKDKVVVEIGGGYGRESICIGKESKFLYIIEIENVIQLLKKFINKKGLNNKTKIIDYNKYKDVQYKMLDVVYSRYVMQHISVEQAKDYIDFFYNMLKYNGEFISQFLVGDINVEDINRDREPRVKYTIESLRDLLHRFDDIVYKVVEVNGYKNRKVKHCYVRAIKKQKRRISYGG